MLGKSVFRRVSVDPQVILNFRDDPADQDERHISLRRRVPAPGRVSSVSFISYGSAQEALANTLKGDADLLMQVNPRWLEFIDGIPRLRVSRLPSPFANGIAFNAARLPREERLELVKLLRNREVRTLAFGDECSVPENEEKKHSHAQLPAGKLDVLAVSLAIRFPPLGPRLSEIVEASKG